MNADRRAAPWRRGSLAVLALWTLLAATPSRADAPQGRCGAGLARWAAACAAREGTPVRAEVCRTDRVVLAVGPGGDAALRVDIAADRPEAIAHAGGLGLDPVGSFDDWAQESAERRQALAAAARCVTAEPSLLGLASIDQMTARASAEREAAKQAAVAAPAASTPAAPPAAAPLVAGPTPTSGLPGGDWRGLLVFALLGLVALLAAARGRQAEGVEGAELRGLRWRSTWTVPVVGLALTGALAAWSISGRDPDFYLPDPFAWLIAGTAASLLLAGLLPWRGPRVLLISFAVAVPVVVVVAEARVASREAETGGTRLLRSDDALLRYHYRPGEVVEDAAGPMTITPDGLWDRPHAKPKPPGTLRVVVLGDSVPNDPSLRFDERFPHRLEQALAEAAPAGSRVEVVNVSCEGYNTLQEVRLYERVGQAYEPDLVVLAYVLNDPFLQNGAFRRFGNSFFAFTAAMALWKHAGASWCSLFEPLHRGYGYDWVVRHSFERLRLLTRSEKTPVLVATLPIVERFDDPICGALFDQVLATASEQGFATARVVDAFAGRSPQDFAKPEAPNDITHPNAAGHAAIAAQLGRAAAPLLWPGTSAP